MPGLRIAALDHRDNEVAVRMLAVWLPAYRQEAALLHASAFPALERSAADFQSGDEHFLGALQGTELLGCLGLVPDDEPDQACISSLVVHPRHQRQGVARALLQAALALYAGRVVAVSTGALNAPALALYRSAGFQVYRHGVIGPEALPLVKLRLAVPAAG